MSAGLADRARLLPAPLLPPPHRSQHAPPQVQVQVLTAHVPGQRLALLAPAAADRTGAAIVVVVILVVAIDLSGLLLGLLLLLGSRFLVGQVPAEHRTHNHRTQIHRSALQHAVAQQWLLRARLRPMAASA